MIGITLDIDWAPDFVLLDVAEILIAQGVRATWFVTHESAAVDRLRLRSDLFELGIHPNFLTGSSHGRDPTTVLRHCMRLVPEAVSMRTHSLVQSSPLLATVLEETPIAVDSSVYLPDHPGLRSVEYRVGGRALVRVPFLWEDDFEMQREDASWDLAARYAAWPGLRVFDFHPIHIYLNSASLGAYQAVKGECARLIDATPQQVDRFVQREGAGTRSAFLALVEYASRHGSATVRELAGVGLGNEQPRGGTT